MPYAQENYQQKLGTGNLTIAQAGCFLTAFSNLLERFGETVPPPTLNEYFIQHGSYYVDGVDGQHEDLAWGSVSAYDGKIHVSAYGKGAPKDNNSIVKFIYRSIHTHELMTHFSLVADAAHGLILDSWDGKVKSWSVYGGPVEFATYVSTAPVHVTPPPRPPEPSHPYRVEVIAPIELITTKQPTNVWDLDATEWPAFKAVQSLDKGHKFKAVAKAHHNLGGVYYMADADTPQGVNAVDTQEAPAAPAPASVSTPATNSEVKVGSIVIPTKAVSYEGVPLDPKVLNREYPVTEVVGDRAVLGNGLNTAFHTGDLKVKTIPSDPTPPAPQKPANTIYTKLAKPLNLVVNKNPTHKWALDFPNDTQAKSVAVLPLGSSFVAYGRAQRTDHDKPAYFMSQEDFGEADKTGIPAHNWGINTVDLNPPKPAAPAAPTKAAETSAAPAATGDGSGDGSVNIPVTVKSWQDSFDSSAAGEYKATTDAIIHDLAGVHADVQLGHDQLVPVAGKVTKDGKEYYVTEKSRESGNWYGIPKNILVAVTNPIADAVKHPAHIVDDIEQIADELRTDPDFVKFKANMSPRGRLIADIAETEEKVSGVINKLNIFKRK